MEILVVNVLSSVQCVTSLLIFVHPLNSCFSDFFLLLNTTPIGQDRETLTFKALLLHFVESLSKQFKRTNVEKVFKRLFIAGPLHQKDLNSDHFIGQWMLILFNLFVTTFLFNSVENKKDKITPTLHAILISCYCQETHRYKQYRKVNNS